MHSSTGYGLTTSNPCMDVTQKGLQMMKCCSPFPMLGNPDPSARAASTPPAGTLPQQRNTPADCQGCTSAICAEGARVCGLRSKTLGQPPGGARQPRTVRLAATPGRGAGARERQRREGAARQAASSASGGGPSVSLDHFPALGKMNHGSAAAGPRPHHRFALSFHIGT